MTLNFCDNLPGRCHLESFNHWALTGSEHRITAMPQMMKACSFGSSSFVRSSVGEGVVYPPPFGGYLRSIPQGMIFDVQPLVKSLFCPIRQSSIGFFDSEASIP